MPTMKPARARSAFFGVRPSSTFWRPLREKTIPSAAQAIEMIDDRPKLSTSRAAATIESTKPATAWPLPGTGGAGWCHVGCCWGQCWGGGGQPGGGCCQACAAGCCCCGGGGGGGCCCGGGGGGGGGGCASGCPP